MAMSTIGTSYPTQEAQTEPPIFVAERRVLDCKQRIEQAIEEVNILADRLLGSVPKAVSDDKQPISPGLLGRLADLEMTVSELEYAIRRFS